MKKTKNIPIDSSRLPQFLRPRLRLFLSADLVGSTKLKQAGGFPIKPPSEQDGWSHIGTRWFYPIAEFYRQMEARFWLKWREICDNSGTNTGPSPALWKTNGDELIFVKEITEADQALIFLESWMDVVNDYRHNLVEEDLDIKCAAWVAGFPVANAEIIFQKDQDTIPFEDIRYFHYYLLERYYDDPSGLVLDFLGPSIDTGFRLAQKATKRKCILSAELAFLICTAVHQTFGKRLVLRYDGRDSLKGVIGEQPYPLFWLDFLANAELEEDRLLGRQEEGVNKESARKYLEKFFSDNQKFIFQPFIVSSSQPIFRVIPENFQENLSHFARKWAKEKRRIENRLKAVAGDEPPGPPAGEKIDASTLSSFAKTVRRSKKSTSTPR